MICSTPTSASDSVVYLAKDKPAPYSGLLFPEENAKELRMMAIEFEGYKRIIQSYEKSLALAESNNTILQSKVNIITDQNIKLNEALNSARSNSFWEKVGWYAAGALSIAVGGFVYSQMRK